MCVRESGGGGGGGGGGVMITSSNLDAINLKMSFNHGGIDGFERKFNKHSGQRTPKESRYRSRCIVDVDPELVGGNSIVG